MAQREATKKRYNDIRTAYDKWTDKKESPKGPRKYTDAYIFVQLGKKFYLSPKTVEDIVYHRV